METDLNIKELLKFHREHKKLATLTAIQAAGRFGVLGINDNDVIHDFLEKPKNEGSWINGGFFVLEPEVLEYIRSGDATIWEKKPLQDLGHNNQLVAYKHNGFWDYMDTLRDKIRLEQLWQTGRAPWKTWE